MNTANIEVLSIIIEKSIANAEIIWISAIFFSSSGYFLTKKRLLVSLLYLCFGLFVLLFLGGLLEWIGGLGSDTIAELQNFENDEAIAFIKEFIKFFPLFLTKYSKTFLLVIFETFIISLLMYILIIRSSKIFKYYGFILFGLIFFVIIKSYSNLKLDQEEQLKISAEYKKSFKVMQTHEDIDIFIYIGESTTTMNMSLYGYPFNTTPKLVDLHSNDDGFLRFLNVKSTHTHTSFSLLRALSILGISEDGQVSKYGLSDVIKEAGLHPKLYSVQPVHGTYASYSKYIFSKADLINPVINDRFKGNLATPKLKDHEALNFALEDSGVVFFHSYAGHLPYLSMIDETIIEPFFPNDISEVGIRGSSMGSISFDYHLNNVNNYNKAIAYIDNNISKAINNIKFRKKPAVFVYFSDHGESVYTNRGHDSSRFIDEMSNVPLLFYFNSAYIAKYPEVFKKYKSASLENRFRILDQISPTILNLLQINTKITDVPTFASNMRHPRPYIIERNTLLGPSRIDLEYNKNLGFNSYKFFGGTPQPTFISIINEEFGKSKAICYHSSNTLAKALRGASVSNCLEFDLYINGNNFDIYHPPNNPTGFQLKHIIQIAKARKNNLWIDAKNILENNSCNLLVNYLEKITNEVGQILVEFPSETVKKLDIVSQCALRLLSIGVRTSYYVPTQFLLPCSDNFANNKLECISLYEYVNEAVSSNIFSDLSFDYRGHMIMASFKNLEKLNFNTWAIKPEEFHKIPISEFKFIIMDTSSDPNGYY